MNDRIILHCDLNNFFASVECHLNPDLKEKCVAVGGSEEDRHGIILAKNERAKQYAVKTGEAIWEAKLKCPELTVVRPHYDAYVYYSGLAKKIYSDYTDMVERFGIDECWLDVTGSTRLFGSGEKIASEIKERMKHEVGLTISAGVSYNKIFAKLASDLKKPDAVTVLLRKDLSEKIWPLPCEKLMGIGYATKKTLGKLGIFTIGGLAETPVRILKAHLGKNGEKLWTYANGLDYAPVLRESEMPMMKSIGKGITCRQNLTSPEKIKPVLMALAENVACSMRKNHVLANVLTVSLKDTDLAVKNFQRKLEQPTNFADDLCRTGAELINGSWPAGKPIRALTIQAGGLVGEDFPFQLSMNEDIQKRIKKNALQKEVDLLQNRFGKTSVIRACLLNVYEYSQIHNAASSFGINGL